MVSGVTMRRRLAVVLLPALVLGALSLTACGLNFGRSQMPTAAQVLQRATSVLDVNSPAGARSAGGATVRDLTYTMKFAINMDMTDPSLGSQKVSEAMTASGEETLHPRRSQLDLTMTLMGTNLTDTVIVDYADQTGYIKMTGLGGLSGVESGKWYTMPFASLGGLGADTSMYIDYSKLKDATLIGAETINGVAVWHLRAKEDMSQAVPGSAAVATSSSASDSVSGTATLDYYFRQDNYRPVKILLASSDTISGLGTITTSGAMNFTTFNTGVSIALPPASEVTPLHI